MIKVISDKPHPSVVKQIICKNCGATLEYVPQDLQEDHHTDYLGDTDYWKYVRCPKCDNKVVVRRN